MIPAAALGPCQIRRLRRDRSHAQPPLGASMARTHDLPRPGRGSHAAAIGRGAPISHGRIPVAAAPRRSPPDRDRSSLEAHQRWNFRTGFRAVPRTTRRIRPELRATRPTRRSIAATGFVAPPCTATEATDGSSGLYSTAADMTSWLRYLLRTDGAGAAAQEVVLLPSDLRSQTGLDHAGEPTGVGLGWIHLLPPDSASHIVEKTGGGAGFQTYIAINHARGTAVFVAATEGSVDTHLNLFNAANKLLLAVAGLSPLPEATTAKAGPNRAPRLHERVREVGLHHGHTRARVR